MYNKYFKDYILAYKHRKFLSSSASIYKKFQIKNSIFIHIPKTAGRSIIKSIYGQNLTNVGHRTYFFYKKLYSNEIFKNMFTFSIVRNPFRRLESAYFYLKAGGSNIHDLKIKNDFIDNYENFDNFINYGLEKAIKEAVIHFTPQNNFICLGDKVVVDFLAKYENLNNDVINLKFKINFESKFIFKKSKQTSYNFTKKNIKVIKKVYEKDFIIFQYDI